MSDRPLEEYSLPYLWKRIEELETSCTEAYNNGYANAALNSADNIADLQAKLDAVETEIRKWKREECSAQQAIERILMLTLVRGQKDE